MNMILKNTFCVSPPLRCYPVFNQVQRARGAADVLSVMERDLCLSEVAFQRQGRLLKPLTSSECFSPTCFFSLGSIKAFIVPAF